MNSFCSIDWQDTKNFLFGTSLGSVIISAPEMTSTQAAAKEAVRGGTPHGSVFVTEMQTSGRGRRDRGWLAVRGKDLTFSTVLKLGFALEHAPLLSLAAALAVCNTLKARMPHVSGASIKWPNDVLAGEKKICGIICECLRSGSGDDYAVIGIGVNVNRTEAELAAPPSPGGSLPTSMLAEAGVEFHMPRILGGILAELDRTSGMIETDGGRARLIGEYSRSCGTLGRELKVVVDGDEYFGAATAITSRGALEVATDSAGVMVFEAADVVHVRFGERNTNGR